ncbi:MAG: UDP-N-acetylmuramoyl-L-alanyl-D-glutamate--2,6-diaminopimelate ligase [Solobacterium sp.]|nr:UDP-N-acetylmuramoyl-L-alanyl-D-glutamate--2,6-diaminopimelate ligase [Solobacterium sp.]
MKLCELFENCGYDTEIRGIKTSSRDIEPGDLFVCIKGIAADRHDFADDAIAKGAAALVVSRDIGEKSVPVVRVSDTNEQMAYIAQKFYGYPERKMKMIGVTGTDGKTSTATILQTLLSDTACGYIGTNGVLCAGYEGDTPNTTPDADKLYQFLDQFVRHGCSYTAMEVSSEALMRGRTKTLEFDVSVFTNITSEHINIHGTFANYLKDKSRLFAQTKKDGFCIINADDENCQTMIDAANGTVLLYGKSEKADLRIVSYDIERGHTPIRYSYMGKEFTVDSPLLGEFNVYNLSAALLALFALGYQMSDLEERLKHLAVDGRVTFIETGRDYWVMVDYAHTPNGIQNILKLADTFGFDRIVTVIGAAGTRDPYKRPLMGKTICDHPKTYGIFTYEDPRTEDPADIAADLTRDIRDYDNYRIILDRGDAIRAAVDMLKDNECALILGKGNEDEEELKDGPIHFNDIEEAKKAIQARNSREK